jgi:predicted transcriptional regulator
MFTSTYIYLNKDKRSKVEKGENSMSWKLKLRSKDKRFKERTPKIQIQTSKNKRTKVAKEQKNSEKWKLKLINQDKRSIEKTHKIQIKQETKL